MNEIDIFGTKRCEDRFVFSVTVRYNMVYHGKTWKFL